MRSNPNTVQVTSIKPLGSLGRDEMNLAEFPIALLTDRVPKAQTEAIYQDEIYDDRTGRTLTRRLIIKAGGYGLTTAADDEVILALIQLTRQKNNFTHRRVDFSRLELIRMLDWPSHGASYERILLSLQRWTSVYLQYENAWRDNKTKTWTSPKGFHIIDNFELNDSRNSGEQFDLLQSNIVWNEVIFESFQAGYLKPLDYDLCTGLRNSTAKRLYRFLDKRFHHKPEWEFDLKELAHMHIGLGQNYEGPAHLKRNLHPAIIELEQVGFLAPLSEEERFYKEGKAWRVRLAQKSHAVASDSPKPAASPAVEALPPLVTALITRGVTDTIAAALVKEHSREKVQAKIEEFDWLKDRNDKKLAKNPAGFLVKSITTGENGYQTPARFVSPAEQQRQREAQQVREREKVEQRQRDHQEAAKARHEAEIINAFWDGMNKEEQAAHDAAAISQADAQELELIKPGPMKRYGMSILRNSYSRKLLQAKGTLPPSQP